MFPESKSDIEWVLSQVMPDAHAETSANSANPETSQSPHDIEVDSTSRASDSSCEDDDESVTENKSGRRWTKKLPAWMQHYYLWWFLAWCCGFILAIRFQWGAVYFALSVLLVIWKGLSDSRQRKRGAPSAYSVFNPNCERIEGTLDAEQLQRQMFFRF